MKGKQGFTLIELIVTIAVLGIITAMAAPSFSNIIASQQLSSSSREVISTLYKARSQAAMLRQPTVVCLSKKSDSTTVDVTACADNLTGYSSMSSTQKNAALQNRVLVANIDKAIKVTSTTNFLLINLMGGVSGSTTFTLCSTQNKQKNIIVDISGTVRQTDGSCS